MAEILKNINNYENKKAKTKLDRKGDIECLEDDSLKLIGISKTSNEICDGIKENIIKLKNLERHSPILQKLEELNKKKSDLIDGIGFFKDELGDYYFPVCEYSKKPKIILENSYMGDCITKTCKNYKKNEDNECNFLKKVFR